MKVKSSLWKSDAFKRFSQTILAIFSSIETEGILFCLNLIWNMLYLSDILPQYDVNFKQRKFNRDLIRTDYH